MNNLSKKWFEIVYSFTGGIIPFGYFTGIISEKEVLKFSPNLSGKQIKRIVLLSKMFYLKIPPKEDFAEEKRNVTKEIIPSFNEIFPYATSAITFGELQGDLDIGLISPKYNSKNIIGILRKNRGLVNKFPIVDWNALCFFVSPNGKSLAEKVIQSRKLLCGSNLSNDQLDYIQSTFNSSSLLFGDHKEVEAIKNYNLYPKLTA